MKVEIKGKEEVYTPKQIVITIETQEEEDAIYHMSCLDESIPELFGENEEKIIRHFLCRIYDLLGK